MAGSGGHGADEIRADGPVPIYRQIAGILRRQIESGEMEADDRLPSESDLVGTYGVSRVTARRAVDLLRSEGLVYTVPQRGTFVTAKRS
jgi:DNA-binding GntR family transcriptional regulator